MDSGASGFLGLFNSRGSSFLGFLTSGQRQCGEKSDEQFGLHKTSGNNQTYGDMRVWHTIPHALVQGGAEAFKATRNAH
jgi:hypothetical protein